MHAPSSENHPRGHSATAFDPSHPYPLGQGVHTVSDVRPHSAASNCPGAHPPHGSHHAEPDPDHSPTPHARCVLFLQENPGLQGQHSVGEVSVHGANSYSPGGHTTHSADARNTVSMPSQRRRNLYLSARAAVHGCKKHQRDRLNAMLFKRERPACACPSPTSTSNGWWTP